MVGVWGGAGGGGKSLVKVICAFCFHCTRRYFHRYVCIQKRSRMVVKGCNIKFASGLEVEQIRDDVFNIVQYKVFWLVEEIKYDLDE